MGTYVDEYGLTALLLCVFQNMTPEQAFNKLNGKAFVKKTITDADIQDMINMRAQGCSYRDIGACYGISDSAAFRRIKNFKEKAIK